MTENDCQEEVRSSASGVHALNHQGDSNEKDKKTTTSLVSSSSSEKASEGDQIEDKIRNQESSSKTDEDSPVKNSDTAKEECESRSLDAKKENEVIMANSDEAATKEASQSHWDRRDSSEDPPATTGDTGRKHEDLRVLVHVEHLMGSRNDSSRIGGEDVEGKRDTKVTKRQDKRLRIRRNPREKEEEGDQKDDGEEESDSEDGNDDGHLPAVEGLEGVVTYPIKCVNCNTVLGLQDEKDTFHFFHVLPGEA